MPSLLLVGGQVGLLCRGDPGAADEDPHVGAEVVPGPLPVLLNTHEVDDGGATGHDREVEDEGGPGGGGDKDLIQSSYVYFDNITITITLL